MEISHSRRDANDYHTWGSCHKIGEENSVLRTKRRREKMLLIKLLVFKMFFSRQRQITMFQCEVVVDANSPSHDESQN